MLAAILVIWQVAAIHKLVNCITIGNSINLEWMTINYFGLLKITNLHLNNYYILLIVWYSICMNINLLFHSTSSTRVTCICLCNSMAIPLPAYRLDVLVLHYLPPHHWTWAQRCLLRSFPNHIRCPNLWFSLNWLI